MQRDQFFYPVKVMPPFANKPRDSYMHAPVASASDAVSPPNMKNMSAFHGVEFQPSEVCPKNFIILDQTNHRSQIMFNPDVAYKYPGLNLRANFLQDVEQGDINLGERQLSSPFEENSDDIDALLSSEDDEHEGYDEEEVSTARTHENFESTCDTCSSHDPRSGNNGLASSILKYSGTSGGFVNDMKHQEMKRMVQVLRGIVPGGNQMNTVAVLDETVRYLKSLKVEVQKLGVGNSES